MNYASVRDILGPPPIMSLSNEWVVVESRKEVRYHSLSLSLTHRMLENLWPPVTFPGFLKKKHQGFKMIFWQENANENRYCETTTPRRRGTKEEGGEKHQIGAPIIQPQTL